MKKAISKSLFQNIRGVQFCQTWGDEIVIHSAVSPVSPRIPMCTEPPPPELNLKNYVKFIHSKIY